MLILYALGYIFTPYGDDALTRTGVIHLVSYPPSATVLVNDKINEEKTPITLSSLKQGRYRIRVEKEDYLPWQADIYINPARAEVVDPLILIPRKKEFEKLSQTAFRDMVPILKTNYVLLLQGKKVKDLSVLNIDKKDIDPVVQGETLCADAEIKDIYEQQNDTRIILRVKCDGETKVLAIDLKDDTKRYEDITFLFKQPEKIKKIIWYPNSRRYLFSWRNDAIDKVDLEKKTMISGWIDQVHGFGLTQDVVLAVNKDRMIEKKWSDDKITEDYPMPLDFQSQFDSKKMYRVEKLTKNKYLFTTEDGDFLLNQMPYRFLNEAVKGYEIDRHHRNILLWTENKIGTLKYRDNREYENIFEKGPFINWLYTRASHLKIAFLAHDGSQVLFQDKKRVYLTRVESYPNERPMEFFQVLKNTLFYYSEEKGSFYFLDRKNGSVITWKLIRDENMLELLASEKKVSVAP